MEAFSREGRSKAKLYIVIAAILVVMLLILYVAGIFGAGGRRLSARRLPRDARAAEGAIC